MEGQIGGFLRQIGNNVPGICGYASASTLRQKLQSTSLLETEISQLLEQVNRIDFDVASELEMSVMIGKGAYGMVFLGYIRGEVVAVKLLEVVPEQKYEVLKAFRRELDCFRRTHECNRIVPIFSAFTTSTHCCLVMPFMEGGSIARILHEEKVEFSLQRRIELALEVAEGMRYLHSLNPSVVHRDLSTQNILFHPNDIVNGHCYISDFGIALVKRKRTILGGTSSHRVPMSPTGHPRYRAPETTNNRLYSKRADVYMFGTVFYEILLSTKPFPDLGDDEVAEATSQGHKPNIPAHLPPSLKKLLNRCWSMHPKRRPSFREICKRLENFLFEMKDQREVHRSAWS